MWPRTHIWVNPYRPAITNPLAMNARKWILWNHFASSELHCLSVVDKSRSRHDPDAPNLALTPRFHGPFGLGRAGSPTGWPARYSARYNPSRSVFCLLNICR